MKYTILYQSREMDRTESGVYTEFLMDTDATTADLPTENLRPGSLAYLPEDGKPGTLYMFYNDGSWGEVGADA